MTTGWKNTRREEHRALAHVISLNVQRTWDSLGAWEQILVAGVLWTTFWVVTVITAYPWLERIVTS